MSLNRIREKVNLLIYPGKNKVLGRMKGASMLVSIFAILLVIYYYGFPQTDASRTLLQQLIGVTFAFYIFHYFIRWFYDFEPLAFLKKTWFEGLLMGLLVVEGISFNLFDTLLLPQVFSQLGFGNSSAFTVVFVQGYLLTVVGVEVFQGAAIIPNIKLNPAMIFALSFVLLIAGGTGLLMLPEMTVQAGSMPFLDALFTSTSATCVTGLIVEDTGTFFSFKGHVVLLLLMKLGGLNIVSFALIMAILTRVGVGLKQHAIIEDFITSESIYNARTMLIRIFSLSILIELLGALAVYALITPDVPLATTGDKVFFSLFHSVSAFNNAGFSTFTDGMYSEFMQHNFLLHVVIGGLIFAGAIGFTTIFDLFSIQKLRDRLAHPWKMPHISSRIAINVYVGLALVGAAAFFLLEANNSLEGMTSINRVITSLFQSISARSAGFNTVDVHHLTLPVLILLVFFMFIGGSTYSTAGGIKTSTFALLTLSAYSTIRGKKNIEVYKRTIPNDILLKAYAVFLFNVGAILVGIFALSITEQHILNMPDRSVIDLIFEEVSAFSTCGLSTGITPFLSPAGKTIVVLSMFIGRIGTLTVAFALSKRVLSSDYKYPDEHIMVG